MVQSNGSWISTVTLSNGSHALTAQITDLAGNIAATSTVTYTLNTTAPTVTEILAFDTGASKSDQITSNDALSGTGLASTVVHFTIDGRPIATTATANGQGNWSFTPSGLADGAHTIVASQTDSFGNTGSATLTFTLDTRAPSVAITSAGGPTNQASQTITGTVDMADAGATVTIFDATTAVATAMVQSNGSWISTVTLSNGSHALTAQITDLAGNTAATSTVTYTLSTTAPTVTEVLAFDTGSSASDHITSNDALSGTGLANAVVHFTVDGSPLAATATTNAPGGVDVHAERAGGRIAHHRGEPDRQLWQHRQRLADLHAGHHGAEHSDHQRRRSDQPGEPDHHRHGRCGRCGNRHDLRRHHRRRHRHRAEQWQLDQHRHAEQRQQRADGPGHRSGRQHRHLQRGHLYAEHHRSDGDRGAGVRYRLVGERPHHFQRCVSGTGLANAVVHFTVDGSPLAATATTNAQGVWTFTPSGLADGSRTMVASQTDSFGNTGSASLTFTLDTTAPSIAITSAGGPTNQANQTITGTVDVADAGTTVTIFDGTTAVGTAIVQSNGSWTSTVTLSSGSNALTAQVTDLAGNTATSSAVTYTLSTTAPTVTEVLAFDTGSSASDHITSNDALSGTGLANAVVHFTVDGSPLAATATTNAQGVWTFTPSGLADGSHTIVASQTDSFGNTGSASLTFTLDTTAPSIAITSAGGPTNQANQTITGTVDVADAGTTVTIFDGTTAVGTAIVQSNGSWTSTVTLSSGSNALTAQVTDLAGNTATSSAVTYTLSTTAPTVTEVLAFDTGSSASDHITSNDALSGTGLANAVVISRSMAARSPPPRPPTPRGCGRSRRAGWRTDRTPSWRARPTALATPAAPR